MTHYFRLTLWPLYAYIYAQSEKAFNSQCKHSIILRHVFFKKWKMIAASERKSIVSIDWCGIWLPSFFQPSFMGVGASDPTHTLPHPQGPRKPISLKYHIELAVPPWKHKIMKSVHIYLHNEVKAFFALCIYICIMRWQVIWKRDGKAVKGLKFTRKSKYYNEKLKLLLKMSQFWQFLPCFVVGWNCYISNFWLILSPQNIISIPLKLCMFVV